MPLLIAIDELQPEAHLKVSAAIVRKSPGVSFRLFANIWVTADTHFSTREWLAAVTEAAGPGSAQSQVLAVRVCYWAAHGGILSSMKAALGSYLHPESE